MNMLYTHIHLHAHSVYSYTLTSTCCIHIHLHKHSLYTYTHMLILHTHIHIHIIYTYAHPHPYTTQVLHIIIAGRRRFLRPPTQGPQQDIAEDKPQAKERPNDYKIICPIYQIITTSTSRF